MVDSSLSPDKSVTGKDNQNGQSSKSQPGMSLKGNPGLLYCISTRKVITYLLCFGVMTIYTQRVNLSVAIVAMVNTTSSEAEATEGYSSNNSLKDLTDVCLPPDDPINGTINENHLGGTFHWSETTQGLVLGAFLYGYIPTQGVGGRLAEIFGGKLIFGLGLVFSTILTFLTPLAANAGVGALVAARAIIGIAQGLNIPTAYAMTSEWSLPEERSTMLAIALTGGHIGNIFTMPLAGVLSGSDFLGGWPSCFYTVGFLGVLASVMWIIGGFDRPSVHPRISQSELKLLQQEQKPTDERKPVIPWLAMLKSLPLWASTLTKMTLIWNYNMVSTKIPAYFESVLHIPITQNGLINALIYGALTVSLLGSAKLCDTIMTKTSINKTLLRKLFQVPASMGNALCLFLLTVIDCNSTAAIGLLTGSMLFYGLAAGGESPNCFDLAPALSGTISGLGNMMASATGAFAPVVAGFFLEGKGNSISQWNYVFYLCAGVGAFGGLSFLFFASGEEQPWASQDASATDTSKTQLEKEKY